MKKIMQIFGIVLFAFTLNLTSCICGGDCADDCTKDCCDKKECSSDCEKACCDKKECSSDCEKACCDKKECSSDCKKACCLGCKATEGEKKCIFLEDGSMPCCTANHNVDIEYSEDHIEESHEGHNHE
jgi:hypothetical protein